MGKFKTLVFIWFFLTSLLLPVPISYAAGELCVQWSNPEACLIQQTNVTTATEVTTATDTLGEGTEGAVEAITSTEDGYTEGEVSTSLSATISKEQLVLSLPLSYAFSDRLKMSAYIPYIDRKDSQGLGNALVRLKYGPKLWRVSAGVRGTNGKDEVDPRNTIDYQLGASLNMGESRFRYFASQLRLYYPEDDNQFDKGDSSNTLVFVSAQVPMFGDSDKIFLGLSRYFAAGDLYRGVGQDNETEMLDLKFGFILEWKKVRFGMTLPLSTESNVLQHEDRSPSLDAGIGLSLF